MNEWEVMTRLRQLSERVEALERLTAPAPSLAVQPGDLVRDVESDRLMTVKVVDGVWAGCEWFEGNQLRQGSFRLNAGGLELWGTAPWHRPAQAYISND